MLYLIMVLIYCVQLIYYVASLILIRKSYVQKQDFGFGQVWKGVALYYLTLISPFFYLRSSNISRGDLEMLFVIWYFLVSLVIPYLIIWLIMGVRHSDKKHRQYAMIPLCFIGIIVVTVILIVFFGRVTNGWLKDLLNGLGYPYGKYNPFPSYGKPDTMI